MFAASGAIILANRAPCPSQPKIEASTTRPCICRKSAGNFLAMVEHPDSRNGPRLAHLVSAYHIGMTRILSGSAEVQNTMRSRQF
jgi:hypothetical protein